MTDPKIVMTANGGDLEVQGNDLALVFGVENTPALAMFGGDDWVGNFLTDKPFDATTEKLLNTVTLNSDGRLQIEKAVNTDLQYLNDIAGTTWSTTVTIVGPKSVKIDVIINGELFSYLWNPFEAPMPPIYIPPALCPLITGLIVTDIQETQITYEWDASMAALGYQYAINTTGATPGPGDWLAAANPVTVKDLTGGTTYYFFVRNRCSATSYSTPVSITEDTASAAPTLPVTAGLIIDLVSSYGLVASGSTVTGWLDQSGLGNDMQIDAGNPTLTPAVFGTEPAVSFSTGQSMITTNPMNGMGLPATPYVTYFVVISHPQPMASTPIINYCNVNVITETGGFLLAVQHPGSDTEMLGQLKGNIGISQSKVIPLVDNAAAVYTAIFDKSLAGVAPEVSLLVDDSATGYTPGLNNDNTNNFSYSRLRIGGTLEGDIARIVGYNRRLTGGEQTSVVNYLKTKYSIP